MAAIKYNIQYPYKHNQEKKKNSKTTFRTIVFRGGHWPSGSDAHISHGSTGVQ